MDNQHDDWEYARKKPVEIEYRGPYTDPDVIDTIEGDFEVDEEYIDEHGGYVIIRGVNGEAYPCALDIFEETYDRLGPAGVVAQSFALRAEDINDPETLVYRLDCGECGETSRLELSEGDRLICPNCEALIRSDL